MSVVLDPRSRQHLCDLLQDGPGSRLAGGLPGAARRFDDDNRGNGTRAEHRPYELIRQLYDTTQKQSKIEFLNSGADHGYIAHT